MSVTLQFTPPKNYNLSFYEIGQSESENGELTIVASGTDIGTYPNWISQINYSGSNQFWYSVRFGTDDDAYTSWSDRMYGRYGAGGGYFIVHPSGSPWVFLIPPQISGVIPNWLDYNYEYTVTIDSSGLYGEGMNYMQSDYTLVFGSELCPAWSTVDAVRLTTGPIIDNIPDDTLNKIIHKVSLQAISKFFSGTNPYGCSYDTIPEPVFRWVTCMSGMLGLNAAIASNANLGNISKRLGSFDIKYGGDKNNISPADVRKSLQDCIAESDILIQTWNGTLIQTAIKSIHNPYITHPMNDPQWGRHPRKVPDDIEGPWQEAYNDVVQFTLLRNKIYLTEDDN